MTQVFSFVFIFSYNFGDIDFSNWLTFLIDFFVEFVFLGSLSLKLTWIYSREILIELILISILMLLIGFILIFFG